MAMAAAPAPASAHTNRWKMLKYMKTGRPVKAVTPIQTRKNRASEPGQAFQSQLRLQEKQQQSKGQGGGLSIWRIERLGSVSIHMADSLDLQRNVLRRSRRSSLIRGTLITIKPSSYGHFNSIHTCCDQGTVVEYSRVEWTHTLKRERFTSNHGKSGNLCSMGRLEISDIGSSWAGAGVGGEMLGTSLGGEPKRHHQGHKARKLKVVRLSDIISVRKLPPHAEALPKDNMAAFCVKTAERNLVFAAMKDEGTVWVERLCEVAFQ
ncbi:hypothetical protein CRUP_024256, partial [Coryphaenoides rupestris]